MRRIEAFDLVTSHETLVATRNETLVETYDSQEIIDWDPLSMTEFNWHYQDFDRSSLEEGRGWIEKRSDIRRRETESANIEMNMLSRGHVFVGSLCSHFSRTILWAIAGRRIMLPP